METKEKKTKKKVVRKYTLVYEVYEDGTNCLKRRNNGLGFITLIGVIDLVKEELYSIFRQENKINVDIVKRVLVKD